MTQPTINLNDGLEALYYLDSDYADPQRDQLQDLSGYGRHADASGGVTVGGAEGPDSFEATSFDGTDDEFIGELPLTFNEFSVAILFKPDAENADLFDVNLFNNQYVAAYTSGGGTNLGLHINDGTNSAEGGVGSPSPDEWQLYVATFDGSTGDIVEYLDSETNLTTSSVGGLTESTYDLHLGSRNASPRNYNVKDIAFFGVWFRTLSDAEIEHLNRMTEPMVNRL